MKFLGKFHNINFSFEVNPKAIYKLSQIFKYRFQIIDGYLKYRYIFDIDFRISLKDFLKRSYSEATNIPFKLKKGKI
jgi:hypothetical protein